MMALRVFVAGGLVQAVAASVGVEVDFKVEVEFCASSEEQYCRMLCDAPTCPSSTHCAMRKDDCCDYSCTEQVATSLKEEKTCTAGDCKHAAAAAADKEDADKEEG